MSTRRSAQKNNGSGFNKKSATFLKSTTAIVAALMLLPTNVGAQDATPTNSWDYDVVVGGNVGKDTSTVGITDITVTGGNGFVEGNADIYDGHTVNVTGDAGTTFAYRDNRDNIDSTLNGNLNSNIQVVIIDKDGLFFGDNFNADVQSLVATTGDISVDNLMDSNADLLISNVGQGGSIVQNGTVTVSEAGLAAFVSPFVTNNGVINATLGTVSFAAGETVTLDLYGDGLVEVAVEGELANALLENRGAILAQGGRVQITAIAAKDTLSNLVNNTGIIDVSSVEVDGGKIVLSGGDAGTVRNAGLLRTSEGGSVDIDAERFVHEGDNFFIIPQRKPDAPVQELQFVDTVEVIEVRPASLAAIETAGGDVNIETSGDVIIGSNGFVYPNVTARSLEGEPTKFDGGAVINADGGDININNDGVFYSAFENTLRTSGEGAVSVRQNAAESFVLGNADIYEGNSVNVQGSPSFRGISVSPPSSIQNAIDAISNTGTGTNTVTVGAGSFGAVEINHANLTLRGANAGIHGSDARGAETIINPNSPGIHITADNAVVNGVNVVGGTAEGILVDNADNVVVTNSVISGSATHGVSVVRSNNVRVRNNDISDTGEVGVKARLSNDAVIANNTIYDVATGIQSDYGHRARIVDNDISDVTKEDNAKSDAIRVNGGQNVRINRNTISNINDDGIFVADASGSLTIRGNEIFDVGVTSDTGSGIDIFASRADAVITDNIVAFAADDGIAIRSSNADSSSVIRRNISGFVNGSAITVDRNATIVQRNIAGLAGEHAIFINKSQGVQIRGNLVGFTDGDGIRLTNSKNALVHNNFATNVAGAGVFVKLSNDSVVSNNEISESGTGIHSEYSDRIKIDGNDISDITLNSTDASDGVFIRGGSSVEVTNNTITDVNDEGIFLTNFTGHAVVNGNTVTNAGLNIPELGNGIELIFANGTADVIGNQVSNVRDNGIFVKQPQAGGTAFNVTDNTISNVGVDGIRIERNAALVANNTITAAGDDGIDVTNSVDAQIINNDVSDVQDTGITVRLSNGVDVDDNDVSDAGTGISVEYSNNALIRGNDISDIRKNNTSAADGIYVEGGSNVGIFRNFVSNVNDDGIFVTNSSGNLRIIGNGVANVGQDISELGNGIEVIFANGTADIDRNSVNGARDFGIVVKQSSVTGTSFDVTNNRVKNVGADGINIDRNANDVSDNTVRAAGDDGIDVTRSVGANISDNTVSDVQDTGITVRLSNDVDVDGNTVSDAGTGVKVAYSNNADITNNEIFDITKNNTSNADAVQVEGGRNITVSGNAITNINDDGIFLTNTSGTTNVFDNIINSVGQDITESGNAIELIFTQGAANVHTNSITSARDTGILIKQSTAGSGPFVVDNNVISSVGASGIDIDKNAASVSNNAVDSAGENGIIVRRSPGVQIVNNVIAITQEAGIRVRLSNDAVVTGNGVFYVGTGIRSDYSNRIQISDNLIRDVVNRNDLFADGIHVSGGSSVVVSGNDINYTNDDSIFVANSTGTLVVDGNDVSNAGLDIDSFGNGIELLFTRGNAVVTNNTVDTVRDSGILIKQTQPSAGSFVVTDNDVANSGVHGFYANGANIDSIVFLGNTLTDNTLAQARFESGAIDMSDITNPNVFLNTTGGPAVGLQFDKTTSSDLTIVGETLGATEFTGYTDVDSFYVRFEDGAILSAPSTPIVIDANAVSFDGVIADAFPGSILPAAQLQFIEDRLFDADDAAVNGRGQIFEPVAPTPAGITNLEDFLQTPEDSQSTSNNASLRINGLPPVSLANVGDLNAVEPAAGDETGELNDIEPAAGDQQLAQVTCASDAANAVGTASVSYVFGGSFEDSLAGAAACSINAI